jgi:hypothetical protein
VATHRTDPAPEIPEADLLDQQTPLDTLTGEPGHSTTTRAVTTTGGLAYEADEADLLEQTMPVPGDEDDYPRDPA